jgi:hypothetical protein
VEAVPVAVGDAEEFADDQARPGSDGVEVFGDDPVEVGLEFRLDALCS